MVKRMIDRQAWRRSVRTVGTGLFALALIGPLAFSNAAAAQGDPHRLDELWSHATDGEIEFSPILDDDVIYVTSSDGTIEAIDAQSGDGLWDVSTDFGMTGFEPAVGDDLLLTLGADNDSGESRLIALELDSEGDDERWSVEFTADDGMPNDQPILTEEGVILVNLFRPLRDDASLSDEQQKILLSVVALDAEDGAELWRHTKVLTPFYADGLLIFPADRFFGYSTVDLMTGETIDVIDRSDKFRILFGDDDLVYGVTDSEAMALEIESGEEVWSTPLDDGTPLGLTFDDDAMYVSLQQDDGGSTLIQAVDRDNGEPLWTSDPVVTTVRAAVAEDGYLYTLSDKRSADDTLGGLVALDAGTGEAVAQANLPGLGLVVADGVIYTGYDELVALAGPGAEG